MDTETLCELMDIQTRQRMLAVQLYALGDLLQQLVTTTANLAPTKARAELYAACDEFDQHVNETRPVLERLEQRVVERRAERVAD